MIAISSRDTAWRRKMGSLIVEQSRVGPGKSPPALLYRRLGPLGLNVSLHFLESSRFDTLRHFADNGLLCHVSLDEIGQFDVCGLDRVLFFLLVHRSILVRVSLALPHTMRSIP